MVNVGVLPMLPPARSTSPAYCGVFLSNVMTEHRVRGNNLLALVGAFAIGQLEARRFLARTKGVYRRLLFLRSLRQGLRSRLRNLVDLFMG